MINLFTNIAPAVKVELFDEYTSESIHEGYANMSQKEYSDLSDCLIYTDRDQWESSPIIKKTLVYIKNTFGLSDLDGFAITITFPTNDTNTSVEEVIAMDDYYDEDIQPYI